MKFKRIAALFSQFSGQILQNRTLNLTLRSLMLAVIALSIAGFVTRERAVLGAGKGRTPASSGSGAAAGQCPVNQTAQPVRPVFLRAVSTKPFQLPNGATVDLAADLDAMWTTAVTQTGVFAPTDVLTKAPESGQVIPECEERLEIRAAVSALELNAFEVGVSFGYSPTETDTPVTQILGKTRVKIGTVRMEFGVRQCRDGKCQELIATSADHATAGVSLDLTVDFSAIKTGPSLMTNTQLGAVLQQVMRQGASRLSQDARVARLPWSAKVAEAGQSGDQGLFLMDAGLESRIVPGTRVEVYAVTPGVSACNVFRVVAYGTALQVHSISSVVSVDTLLDSRGIQAGDLVRLRAY